ncbi:MULTISPECIES: sulfite exporter TauE/SafE family protein [unclassified Corynebacterium]|uniref:sulfite exporter TauE/SafE family protein n=1 Tax=unclassified Corynebacterium TaxID=2624378 RepID=UPI0029C9BDB9|nr:MULTISPECIES: sulfite exporter TauE/SafE family protein [unclassified Corynebacterium]WPF65963.1 sulfite exporter TauE/SafE family protein [Corynebacterium sp. 22KM0430]WPF68456.1 sulfite exporter TauE/SafE family protein [Corynebacterium sp. 21KM1197]
MRTLILVCLGGLAAQLVDGGLGMGFGVTSTTILIALAGIGPAQASAVVHTAELGTTLASGLSHWRFGNVDWRVVGLLAVPGAVGAFAGATALANVSTEAARPITAAILLLIGVNLLWRFSRGRVRARSARPHHSGFLAGLGLFGGFIDASGGGGWGPVTTSTLLGLGRTEPRRVVGTVNTAEFLVTLAAVVGFVLALWEDLVAHFVLVCALLIGGVVAAPIAAWLVTRLNPAALGVVVGALLMLLNLPTLCALVGVPGQVVLAAQLMVLAGGVILALRAWRRAVREHRPAARVEEAPVAVG